MNAMLALEKYSKTWTIIKALSGKVAPFKIGVKYRKLSPKLKLTSSSRHEIWIKKLFFLKNLMICSGMLSL